MALTDEKKQKISEEIKKMLLSRVGKFPKSDHQNRNAPFHDVILKAFEEQLKDVAVPTPYLVAISSWMHGLSTSLGSGFESLAHILSGGYKRKFTGPFTLTVKESQVGNIETIIRELKSGIVPNLKREHDLIYHVAETESDIKALEFTVDNYVEGIDFIDCIELKTVRPNSGEGRGEKQKILYAKASFKRLHPTKKVSYYVGFPFDPTSTTPTGFDKGRFFNYLVEFKKFFSYEEVLLGPELWDHLSGEENTMEEIFQVITKTIEMFNLNR